jgi:surface antigen
VGAGAAGGAASPSGSASAGAANGGAAAGGGGSGHAGNDNGGSVAAFMASPVFSRVAATVPTTITATPVVVSRLGIPCQTMTQTVEIGGQNVHASAVLCRQPDGRWQIQPPQNARLGTTAPVSPSD